MIRGHIFMTQEDNEEEEEYFLVGHSRVKTPLMIRRLLGAGLCVCWLIGVYWAYVMPDTHGREKIDCMGANANVTLRYRDGDMETVHTVFGVFSGSEAAPLVYDTAMIFNIAGIEPENACGPVNVTRRVDPQHNDSLGALVARGGCLFEEKINNLLDAGLQLMVEYDRIHDGNCVLMPASSDRTEMGGWVGGVSITSRAAYDYIAPYVPRPQKDMTSAIVLELSRGRKNHELFLGVLDMSEVALLVFAVTCLLVGTWFALYIYDEHEVDSGGYSLLSSLYTHDQDEDDQDEDSKKPHILSMKNALSFIWIASGMLLVLFFLSSTILASIFALAFAVAGSESGYMIIKIISSVCIQKIWVYIPSFYGAMYAIEVANLSISTAISGLWLLGRSSWFFYIGQNILAFFILIYSFSLVRVSSLRVFTVILGAALVYDAFWVYIQPRLTGSSSVMVGVVEGLSLPLFVSFPQWSTVGSAVQFSALGLGDIALPGLCIVFAGDVSKHKKTVSYFLCTMVAYVVGLLLCFLALAYNVGGQSGQPALVYIAPCILVACLGCAWYRGEFMSLWTPSDDHHPFNL